MFFRALLLLFCLNVHANSKPATLTTLSPHLTELVYSAGAGDQLIGVSAYSDFPEQATSLPIIGDAFAINQEQLLLLKPDYVLYWEGNIAQQMVTQVENLGLKAIAIKTQNIEDIPKAIEKIAHLAGSTITSQAAEFSNKITALTSEYKSQEKQSAMIQISDRPIYTVNGQHWMSQALSVCGLDNVFSDLPLQSASVGIESIMAKNPDVLIRFGPLNSDESLAQASQINAIKNKHIITVNPDHFSRPTLRLLLSIEHICQAQKTLGTKKADVE